MDAHVILSAADLLNAQARQIDDPAIRASLRMADAVRDQGQFRCMLCLDDLAPELLAVGIRFRNSGISTAYAVCTPCMGHLCAVSKTEHEALMVQIEFNLVMTQARDDLTIHEEGG